jgi:hypothetical protein
MSTTKERAAGEEEATSMSTSGEGESLYFKLKNRPTGPHSADDIHRMIADTHFLGRRCWTCETISKSGRPSIELVAAHAEIEPATEQEWQQRLALAVKFHAEEQAEEQKRSDAEAYGVSAGNNRRIVRVSPTRYTDQHGGKWMRNEITRVDGVKVRGNAWKVGASHRFSRRDMLSDEVVTAIEAACGGAASYDFIKEGKKKAATLPLKGAAC